jgi:2'-hydroxyisoflavone reductase
VSSSRREFIKGSLLGGAAVASTGLTGAVLADEHSSDHKPLEILVLGGTGFIGPHMVREALRRGHTVTLFNRGRTNDELFPDLETIQGDRGGDLSMLEGRKWDAVIDNSGYVPRHVQNSARTLAPNVGQYLFISTVAVYDSFATLNDESSRLASLADETIEEVNGETYGPLKALCEKRARAEIDADRLTVLRPTYICGPGDHTDRFTYWPVRVSKGGEMLLPGGPDYPLQIIDVRDLTNFTIDCLDREITDTFNTVTPVGSYNMGQLLADSQAVTATDVDPVWVDESFANDAQADNEVQNRGMFPIWHPIEGDQARESGIAGGKAVAAGLHNRPVRETIRDLLAWWKTLPDDRRSSMKAGMSAALESELIAAWKAQNA